MKYTEEDLRTKVIYTWLKDLGFEDEQLHFEYSFKINLGKYTYKVQSSSKKSFQEIAYPRADILVKDNNNKNLLIIEVKEPNHKLDEKDKLQAISYARLLTQIAPFTILTNGKETIIYDSITAETIQGEIIPFNHPYIQNNFRVTNTNFKFYNNALEVFISISKENLLKFCELQVQESMRLLKSDNIDSGKKYIPSLYVDRKKEEKNLKKLIYNEENNLIFITGSPQHGKTSFICNFVEKMLQNKHPCIFYPAINIHNSLFDEMESDFRWILSENSSIYNIITHKIQDILKNTNSRLFIFLDGLNEASLKFIATLNKNFSKLKNLNITFILSFTNITAKRLFTDKVNNITDLADYLNLSIRDLEALEIDSKNVNKNIITIPPYNNNESSEALKKYSEAYNVTLDTDKLIHDPFLLRIVMSYNKNSKFYGHIDEVNLLKNYINEKSLRTKDLDEITINYILENISKKIFNYDSPISFKNILSFIDKKNIDPLFESALLARTYIENEQYLEFYNEREQFYFISIVLKEWDKKLHTFNSFIEEGENALKTNAGKLAFSWYLKINPFCIKDYWKGIFEENYINLQSIFLNSLRLFLINKEFCTEEWMANLLEKGLNSEEKKIKVESFKLIKYFPELKDEYLDYDHNSEGNQLFLEEILFKDDEEIGYDPFDIINYTTIKEIHDEEYCSIYDDSSITEKLKTIILKKRSIKALEILAYCSPYICIDFLIQNSDELVEIVNKDNLIGDYLMSETQEYYYGSMCPGYLEGASKEEVFGKIIEYHRIYDHISAKYNNKELLDFINERVNDFFSLFLDSRSLYSVDYSEREKLYDFEYENLSQYDIIRLFKLFYSLWQKNTNKEDLIFIQSQINSLLILLDKEFFNMLIEYGYLFNNKVHIDHPKQSYINFNNL